MSRLTWDGTAEPVSRDQCLRRERGQRNIYFPCLADHEQDWQPYPVDLYSAIYMMIIQYNTEFSQLVALPKKKCTPEHHRFSTKFYGSTR